MVFESEIVLDGTSKAPMMLQHENFDQILVALQDTPRIASIHSYCATAEVVEELSKRPIKAAILH